MELPFAYDKVASGNNLIGRKDETALFIKAFVEKSKGAAVIGGPKTGKESLIRSVLSILMSKGINFNLVEIDLFNIRSHEEFITLFRKKVMVLADKNRNDTLLSFDIEADALTDRKILDLPQVFAEESGKMTVIYFREFQNILNCESAGLKLEELDRIFSKQKNVRYIFTGSHINTMKFIFLEKMYFYYMVDTIELAPLREREVRDYVYSTFLNIGRVIEESEADEICHMVNSHPWYVKQLCTICHSLPIGYVNKRVVQEAKATLLSIHMPRFKHIMLDITPNQINFLKAVLDGVPRFSSSEILEKYRLNSSANVLRIKDALKKKEVITFDRQDNAQIIDPLFEYWLRNFYFAQI